MSKRNPLPPPPRPSITSKKLPAAWYTPCESPLVPPTWRHREASVTPQRPGPLHPFSSRPFFLSTSHQPSRPHPRRSPPISLPLALNSAPAGPQSLRAASQCQRLAHLSSIPLTVHPPKSQFFLCHYYATHFSPRNPHEYGVFCLLLQRNKIFQPAFSHSKPRWRSRPVPHPG